MDIDGKKLVGSPDTRAALTVWQVMPPLPPGINRRDRVAIGFGVFCTGEPMHFRVPNLIIRKQGGASWKEARNVRLNISDIRVFDQDGKQVTKPIHELSEGPVLGQFTAQDDDTITCWLESLMTIQEVGAPRYFVVVIRIGETADIASLSCDLESTMGDISGTVSGRAQRLGRVVGPMVIIQR
jgi:hypothetical protein